MSEPTPLPVQAPVVSREPSRRATRLLLAGCFFLSGGAGLVYEVLWARHLHLLFGSTTESVAVVLATFMAGLGLGGHLLGRLADRTGQPMRLYGLCEIGIGLYALATGPLLALSEVIYSAAASHLEPGGGVATLLKIGLSALVLLPPATLMGGTLPALLRATADNDEQARTDVGLLYALNTLGAVVGTLAAGLLFIEVLGLSRTMMLTAVTNLGIGLLVVARSRRLRDRAPVEPPAREGALAALRLLAASPEGRYAIVGLFVSGAATMLYEVVFTRLLGMVFGVSSYAFTIVLGVFLAGLGLGALVANSLARRRTPRVVDFGYSQTGLALLAALAMASVPLVPRLVAVARQVPDLDFWTILTIKAGIAVGILLPVAIVAGLGVPMLLAALASDRRRLGRVVGDAYAINTCGTIVGSLVTGFVLVPWERLGSQGALRVAIVANAAVGLWGMASVFGGRRLARLAGAGLAAAAVAWGAASARWPTAAFLYSDSYPHPPVMTTRLGLERRVATSPREVGFFAEGREATVAVLASRDTRTLVVNGHPDASDRIDMGTQLMLGVVPLIAHPRPEQVLVVGFGSGVTAMVPTRLAETRHIEVVELEPAVLDASPLFHHVNGAVERHPKVRVVRDDARSYVAATPRRYDVIVSEPSNPWRAGVATLFTTEFYQSAERVLAPRGIFAQWVQLYALNQTTLKMILRTLAGVFPELQVWWLDSGNIVVLASREKVAIDRARGDRILSELFPVEMYQYVGLHEAAQYYSRYLAGTDDVRAFLTEGVRDSAVHTDDLPLLEFEAPRDLYWSDDQNVARLISLKLRRGAMLPPLVGPAPPADIVWAGIAAMCLESERVDEARGAIERALAVRSSPYMLARAAEIASIQGDRAASADLLARALESKPADEEARVVAAIAARVHTRERRPAEALEALDRSGATDGRRGVDRFGLLVALRRFDEAFELAARLLDVARPGPDVGSEEVARIYDGIVEIARAGGDARRGLSVVIAHPLPSFPVVPRERALGLLCHLAGRTDLALGHAREALRVGPYDQEMMVLELRCLIALQRTSEAAAARRQLMRLAPAALREHVASPLLEPARPGATGR